MTAEPARAGDLDALLAELDSGRAKTLRLIEGLGDDCLCAQPHAGFSPIGWHLGHVAFTEAQWVFGRLDGEERFWKENYRRWAQDGCDKKERRRQPTRSELLDTLAEVRGETRARLAAVDPRDSEPLVKDGYLLWFLAAHEHQHRETIALVLQLLRQEGRPPAPPAAPSIDAQEDWIPFAGGPVTLGTDARLAYDNERARHERSIAPFELAATPVTVGDWEAFRAADGYGHRELWSADGWAWRVRSDARAPSGWTELDGRLARPRLSGELAPLGHDEPVVGISAHEADAYAAWRGARLPTEAEWAYAAAETFSEASCVALTSDGPRPCRPAVGGAQDLLGNVWEWTSSPFAPFPDFSPFPYRGYSAPYFDGVHRVLRGGSFATDPHIARPGFRNWYQPWVRQVFAGVRLARDAR